MLTGRNKTRRLGVLTIFKQGLKETIKTFPFYQAACYYRSEYGVTLSVDEILDGVNQIVEKYYLEEVPLNRGGVAFLEHLHKNGNYRCIATATDKHLVEAALKRCGISRYFSEIFTCISVGYGKDEPVIYREAWKYHNTNKSGTVVIEVAAYAVKTAKNDGFITVATFDRHEKCQDEIRAFLTTI